MPEFPHRCADCLDELPRTARRFVVVVDRRTIFGETYQVECVVCEQCVGWYRRDYPIEVTADEVGL